MTLAIIFDISFFYYKPIVVFFLSFFFSDLSFALCFMYSFHLDSLLFSSFSGIPLAIFVSFFIPFCLFIHFLDREYKFFTKVFIHLLFIYLFLSTFFSSYLMMILRMIMMIMITMTQLLCLYRSKSFANISSGFSTTGKSCGRFEIV